MLTTEETKSHAYRAIDSGGDGAVRISKEVLARPEPGYREHNTAGLTANEFAVMQHGETRILEAR